VGLQVQGRDALETFAFVDSTLTPTGHPVLAEIDILIGAHFLRLAGKAGVKTAGKQQIATFPFVTLHHNWNLGQKRICRKGLT
jgi:hypothetical protein